MPGAAERNDLVVEVVRALEGLSARQGAVEKSLDGLRSAVDGLSLQSREHGISIEGMARQLARHEDRIDREEQAASARWAGLSGVVKGVIGIPAVQTLIVLALAGWLGISAGMLQLGQHGGAP